MLCRPCGVTWVLEIAEYPSFRLDKIRKNVYTIVKFSRGSVHTMLGIYNYTVILTYLGMLSGFAGVLCVVDGKADLALIFLVVAGICDVFDGKVASTKKDRTRSEKRFGIQIDSLSDLVCFGVLPASIVYSASVNWLPVWLRAIICGAYVLAALIRLAWFNVDEESRQDFDTGRRKVYLGLPVTSAAGIFPLLTLICAQFNLPFGLLSIFVLLLVAAAFLTPFSIRKPSLNVKRKPRLRGSRRQRRKRKKEAES